MSEASRYTDEYQPSNRGFMHAPEIKCTYGSIVRVYESSAAESPHIWIRTAQLVDMNRPDSDERVEAVAHLTRSQAIALAEQLLYLATHHYHGPIEEGEE